MNKTKFKQTETCGERSPEQGEGRSRTIGEIPEGWNVKKLLDFCNILMGQSPPSTTYNTTENGLPFFQGRKDFGGKYPTKTIWCSEPARIANSGDVLLSVRAPVGDVNVAIEKCCIGRGVSALSIRNNNKEFLYYLLLHNQNRLKQIFESEGTVFGCVTKDGLKDFEVILPMDDKEQYAIAKILSDLDEKIELNHQMNKTLESIAQAIFKRWFVEFEFPDACGRPGKCEEVPLGTLVTFVKGRKPSQTYLDNIAGTLPQILIEVLDGAEPSFAYPENMIMCGQNDVLMVMDGASSGRTEIGFSGIIGSTLAKIICQTEKITAAYLYFYLKNRQKEIAENTTGSAIPHADRKRIEAMIVALPNQPILEAFTSFTTKLFQQVWENKKQIKILSQIRDSLLPKLMSGKIRIGYEN